MLCDFRKKNQVLKILKLQNFSLLSKKFILDPVENAHNSLQPLIFRNFYSWTQSWHRLGALLVKIMLECAVSWGSVLSSIVYGFFCRFQVQHLLGAVCTNHQHSMVRKFCWERRKEEFYRNSLHSTFAWNFIDVYLIIISILLTQKFSCVNRKLQSNHRVRSSQFWNEMWCAYKVSVDLVDQTNELNGGTILISFFSNLYFICVQLLGCFKSESSLLDGLYLWFSLIFLIGRTLGKNWFASIKLWIYFPPISKLFAGSPRKSTTNLVGRSKSCVLSIPIILMWPWNASVSSWWVRRLHWAAWISSTWRGSWFWVYPGPSSLMNWWWCSLTKRRRRNPTTIHALKYYNFAQICTLLW